MKYTEENNTQLDNQFSAKTRVYNIEKLRTETFDLLIIGGGITGAGTACVASNQGIKTALVEMNDFASGTSSKSSKLLHGGVRYLEQYQFKLVFEALKDRNDLFKTIPHIAKPLSFIVPIYKNYKETVLLMNLGLSLYDFLSYISGNMVTKIHKFLTGRGVINYENKILQNGLKGGIQYFDGHCDDSRLTLENIKTAQSNNTVIANYIKIINFKKDDNGQVIEAVAKDLISNETFVIKAKKILNAAGPWLDSVNKSDNKSYKDKLRPTKGVHIIIPKVTDGNALLIKTPTEPIRWVFIIPYQNYSMVGTTDTEAKNHDDYTYLDEDNYASADEIKYLLETVNHYFPNAIVTKNDIVSSFGGWRPLIAPPEDMSESDISREHQIFETDSGIICIAGGKLTAYVSMAQEIVEYVNKKYNLSDKNIKIKDYPQLLSWKTNYNLREYISNEQKKYSLTDHQLIERLINKYGTEYYKIYQIIQLSPIMREEIDYLSKDAQCLRAEVIYSVLYEMTMTVNDFMIRRHRIILQDINQGLKALNEITDLLSYTIANNLSWTEEHRIDWSIKQKEEYMREMNRVNQGLKI